MGRASRWFKGLLGMKKDKENGDDMDRKEKKRWSFGKPMKESSSPVAVAVGLANANPPPTHPIWIGSYMSASEKEQNKHAIAVAAATAAAADAAVAAAQAAVAVVRLTSHGRGTLSNGGRERWAAVKIQTVFRAHLARKALRALKGLVKLQALVRGFLVRKRAAATLYSMQALVRAQAAVRWQRARRSFRDHRIQPENRHHRKYINERFDHETRSEIHSKRLSTSYESTTNSYEESPRIVEIDTYMPHGRSRRIHATCTTTDSSEESHNYYHNMSSPLPCPVPTRHLQESEWGYNCMGDDYRFSQTAQSTPRFATSNRSNPPGTPAKSVCGDSFLRPYSNHPSYMGNTQSFKAKQRSHSAPKQRPEGGAKKRASLIEIMESRSSLSGVRMQRSCTKAQEAIMIKS